MKLFTLFISLFLATYSQSQTIKYPRAAQIFSVGLTVGYVEYGSMKDDSPSFLAEKLTYAINNAEASGCIPTDRLKNLRRKMLNVSSSRTLYQEIEAFRRDELIFQIANGCSCSIDDVPLTKNPLSCSPKIAQDWGLAGGNPREMVIPFRVGYGAASIKVRIRGGHDDSGDGAVHLILKDENGRVSLEKNSNSSDSEWHQWIVPTDGQSLFYFYLQDYDSVDGGRYPGNGGKVEIECGDFTNVLSCYPKIAQNWSLAYAGNPREKIIPFQVPIDATTIKIKIRGGFDDSGDGAVHIILKDENGRVKLEKNSDSTDSEWDQWIITPGGQSLFYLYFQDYDSVDGGRYPGNGGKVEISCN